MLLRFLRWMAGYVLFIGMGGYPEKFMNLAARANITLWQVKNSKGSFQARVAKSQYRELRRPAKKAGMRLRVKKRKGFPLFYAPLPPPPGTSGGNRFVFRDHLVFVASRMDY